mmetsp:Transcript_21072/g.43301  ORF Transcript_21072/g.43301 Transcript_21072/m.43301 type:complete len:358 (+) Transcript_21072:89-1162(+)
MTTITGALRRSQRLAVALALAMPALSFVSLTTAFVVDTHICQHYPSTNDNDLATHRSCVLRSFGNNYVDFGDTQNGPITEYNRVPIIAGNWKLNPTTVQEASALLNLLASNFINHRNGVGDGAPVPEVVVFPPFPFLERAVAGLEGTGIKVGAQNAGIETKGAFTGEVSPSMVRSLGCDYLMVGHSERRTLFKESDETINAKIKLSLKEGLNIILCVGETLEEYENNLLSSVVNFQIKKAMAGIKKYDIVDAVSTAANTRLVIAYEPVWAIGTGKVATPQQAQVAHEVVRNTLEELYGADLAESIRIQYGGSVTPDSISDLISMPDVDGALVGGASLTADGFTRIVDGSAAPPLLYW